VLLRALSLITFVLVTPSRIDHQVRRELHFPYKKQIDLDPSVNMPCLSAAEALMDCIRVLRAKPEQRSRIIRLILLLGIFSFPVMTRVETHFAMLRYSGYRRVSGESP
jgi:hypothetical protein